MTSQLQTAKDLIEQASKIIEEEQIRRGEEEISILELQAFMYYQDRLTDSIKGLDDAIQSLNLIK